MAMLLLGASGPAHEAPRQGSNLKTTKARWISMWRFAVFKMTFLKGQRYRDFDKDGMVTCEHVGLHQGIRSHGGRLFVFPSMMNSTPYEHVKNATRLVLLAYSAKRGTKITTKALPSPLC
jgi:hypothetical protein